MRRRQLEIDCAVLEVEFPLDDVKIQRAWETAARRWHPRKRAEQQRSLETRASILNAAIAEFAERGFEGARFALSPIGSACKIR